MPRIIHREAKHPVALVVVLGVAFSGALNLAGLIDPPSINEALPYLAQKLWALMWMLGGVAAFWGAMWNKNIITALEIEALGYLAIAASTITYGSAILLFNPVVDSGNAAISSLVIGVASIARVLMIYLGLKRVKAQTVNMIASGTVPEPADQDKFTGD